MDRCCLLSCSGFCFFNFTAATCFQHAPPFTQSVHVEPTMCNRGVWQMWWSKKQITVSDIYLSESKSSALKSSFLKKNTFWLMRNICNEKLHTSVCERMLVRVQVWEGQHRSCMCASWLVCMTQVWLSRSYRSLLESLITDKWSCFWWFRKHTHTHTHTHTHKSVALCFLFWTEHVHLAKLIITSNVECQSTADCFDKE